MGYVRGHVLTEEGRLAASFTQDAMITGSAVATLTGHEGPVQAVAFSPDGTRLASGGGGAVRITDIRMLAVASLAWRRLLPVRIRNRFPPRAAVLGAPVAELGTDVTSIAYSPRDVLIATGHEDGYVSLLPSEPASLGPVTRFLGLRDSGWAVLYGEDRYRLRGDPAGRFWWTAGLCRFEPGEIDGHGVERL